MKAVVYYAPGDIRVEDVPKPQAGPDELLVKVDACAVCGTDLKSYKHGNPRIKAPLTIGHEFTGLVDTVGSRVPGFAAGERIVMATSISCGRCLYCRQGWRNLCLFASLPVGASTLQLDSRKIHYGELRVIGSSDSTAEHVREAVALMAAGTIPAARLASHILPLEDLPRAFELMTSGEALRVVLKP
jgi:threonine dehydrogenase-like Zn-dependent dehydrogenase